MALPLFIFLKAPLQAGGYKAELGPLHPPARSTRALRVSSPEAGSGGFSLGLLPCSVAAPCQRLNLHSPVQEVLALI